MKGTYNQMTDGNMPIAARTEGRERMPSETVSAIMTDEA